MSFSAGTRSGILLMLLIAVMTGPGCASRRNTELLEAQLRDREDELHQAQSELNSIRTDLVATRREITQMQTQLASVGGGAPAPETTRAIAQATGIRINSMQTGGLDQDDQPGDDVLHTVIEPLDGHGQVIAVPGELTVEVIDPSLPPAERQISGGTWPADEAAALWHAGLLTTGYRVQLPWQQTPGGRTVVLHVRLKTPDGRQFDSTETVSITPPAAAVASQPLPTEPPVTEPGEVNPASPPASRLVSRANSAMPRQRSELSLRQVGFQKMTPEDPPFRRIEEPAPQPASPFGAAGAEAAPGTPASSGTQSEVEELFQLPRTR